MADSVDDLHISQILLALGFGLLLPLLMSSMKTFSVDEKPIEEKVEAKPPPQERKQAKPPPEERKPKPTPRVSPDALLELIKSRRSIFPKDYTGGAPSRANLDMMLEAANWVCTMPASARDRQTL
jgi:hypothetical protein